jgi:sugar phosphate isomerase/epimerase
MERLVQTLREVGFQGPLNVERETANQEERLRDMRAGVELLRTLTA